MGSIASKEKKNYFAKFKTFVMPNSSKEIHPKRVKVIIKKKISVRDFEVALVSLF